MEQYFANFETLLGNSEAALKHVNDLKAFASKTPFEMTEIADASKTLLSFGVENEKVLGILGQLGDVSLGNKEKFSSLALVYGQVASQGKLMGQDLLQCINAGFNPLQVISEHTGKSMAELKEEMSKGAITAEMVAQAFQWATEEGGMFAGGMEKASKTMEGQISTLKDNAIALVGEVVEPISQSMTDSLLPSAIKTIEEIAERYRKDGLQGLIEASGEAFSQIVAGAAEKTPGMVQTGIDFGKALGIGLIKNAPSLKQSVKQMVRVLYEELLKILPESVREPVKRTVEEITKSFSSGNLKKALTYTKKLFLELAEAGVKLGSAALPKLVKGIDFCADHLDTLVPLVVAYFTAMKSYVVVTKAASAIEKLSKAYKATSAASIAYAAIMKADTAVTGASATAHILLASTMTANEIIVGVLTGRVSLATAAQLAWNAAMNANPIGIIITLVAALAGGVAFLATKMGTAQEETDGLAASNKQLADSFSGIGEAAKSFEEGISKAGTIFDQFNSEIVVSSEKQQELADSMDSVQRQITSITGTYVDERKKLTESEIQELDNLFIKLHEQAAKELEAQQAYQTATEERARLMAETFQGTVEEYAAQSQSLINTAQTTREEVIAKADEQFNEELALLQLRLQNDETYTQAMYEAEARAAQDTYNAAVTKANQQCGDTLAIMTEGYANRATALQESNATMAALREEELLENETYNQRKEELEQALKDNLYSQDEDAMLRQMDLAYELQDLEEEHKEAITGIHEEMSKAMDDEAQNQAGTLIDMAGNVELYGGKIKKNTDTMVTNVITSLKTLPPDAKQVAVDTMQGMLDGLASKEGELYAKADSIANGVVSRLKKALEVNSPSKKAKRIFMSVGEGGVLGLEDSAGDLYKKADDIANGVISRLGRANTGFSGLADKARAAVLEKMSWMSEGGSPTSERHEDEPAQEREVIDYERMADATARAMEGKVFKVGEREFARLIEEVSLA